MMGYKLSLGIQYAKFHHHPAAAQSNQSNFRPSNLHMDSAIQLAETEIDIQSHNEQLALINVDQ